jgi:hypothetical protein
MPLNPSDYGQKRKPCKKERLNQYQRSETVHYTANNPRKTNNCISIEIEGVFLREKNFKYRYRKDGQNKKNAYIYTLFRKKHIKTQY